MIFYSSDIYGIIGIVCILMLIAVYIHFVKKNAQLAILFLIFTGFIIRLFMASAEPFLQDWDERFHALVAKNLIDFPLQPMLRIDPIIPYKMEDWCCNHIWVHKQPLFLWQMAISMKVFGVNEIAMRLPSVLMGTFSIFFIYDIAKKWVNNIDVAFLAALLFSLSFYQLELTSGRFSLDQNDVAFTFYVTASIWAYVRYLSSLKKINWAILVGVFVGCAVLNKWLVGLLIFGGWGLYILMNKDNRFDWSKWRDIGIAFIVSLLVFIPWQLYIYNNFPLETSLMFESNSSHIFEDLGHPGSILFHLNQMRVSYGQFLLVFIPIGFYYIIKNKKINMNLTISFVAMIVVIFSFFSIIVKTKMPAFTFPVNSLIWIVIATGIVEGSNFLLSRRFNMILPFLVILIGIYTLKPWQIVDHRSVTNSLRNKKIANTNVYKTIDLSKELEGRVILNCKTFEDVELMFYKDVNAFHWYPKEQTLDSLIQNGYKFAAFKNHNNQLLPDYITQNKDIIIIDEDIK